MDWIPIVFVIFKFLVLGTGMYYAIKWHYDQGKKVSVNERRAVLRAGARWWLSLCWGCLGWGWRRS